MEFCQRIFPFHYYFVRKMSQKHFVEKGGFQLKTGARFTVLWNEQSHIIWWNYCLLSAI